MSQHILSDGLATLKLVYHISWRKSVTAWLFVPVGIMLTLLFCFAVDSLISLSSASFPASVACMMILFSVLILCDSGLGDKKTKAIVGIVNIPAGFALRYINIFFTPSFVLLPLSPAIAGVEVGKIIAVFILGYLVVFGATAYMVRGLQIFLGSKKRALTERAEEMGPENDSIPLAETMGQGQKHPETPAVQSSLTLHLPPGGSEVSIGSPSPHRTPRRAPGSSSMGESVEEQIADVAIGPSDSRASESSMQRSSPRQAPLSLTRPQRWAAFINLNINQIAWSIMLFFIGLPIYYTTGYAMPAQLTVNVLAYFAAISLPAKWRQFLHPVLISSLITVLIIWILGLFRGNDLDQVLAVYKTDSKYTNLFHGGGHNLKPGAADIFGSVLDASIVALALPMFQYRKELFQHCFAIVIPTVTVSTASLFGYPASCYAIGISPTRSLAFAARSLTLALATPAVSNLGGDQNTVAALCIMSGILGVLIGPKLLQWLRIPEDDYVTRGVTLGSNSSAIATALLLVSDPRAAALSSLSMALFGLLTVALTSVPPVVRTVLSLVT